MEEKWYFFAKNHVRFCFQAFCEKIHTSERIQSRKIEGDWNYYFFMKKWSFYKFWLLFLFKGLELEFAQQNPWKDGWWLIGIPSLAFGAITSIEGLIIRGSFSRPWSVKTNLFYQKLAESGLNIMVWSLSYLGFRFFKSVSYGLYPGPDTEIVHLALK